jgi:hypothetical protein
MMNFNELTWTKWTRWISDLKFESVKRMRELHTIRVKFSHGRGFLKSENAISLGFLKKIRREQIMLMAFDIQ